MERLQTAIEKARTRRQQNATSDNPKKTANTPAEGPNSTTERWQALAEFTPSPAALRRNRIVGGSTGNPSIAVDMLRAKLLHQLQKSDWRRLMVTSPGPGCGKSTTCANLALSLSRKHKMRTIVFDFDVRKPALAKLLGFTGPGGMATVLDGRNEFEEQAVRVGPNLAVCMGSETGRSAAEILSSPDTGALLDRIAKEYEPDLMLFDMPPFYSNSDTAAVAPLVDCALLIIAAEQTHLSEIDSCERDLAEVTNIVGMMINKCRFAEPGQGDIENYY